MKVCPTCQTRYDQGEEYCPNDGAELVEASNAQPGGLEGEVLGDDIRVEEFRHRDELGERYDGTLVGEVRPVEVTVLNAAAEVRSDRLETAESLFETLRAPVPPEIAAVHSFDEADNGWFVVEGPPPGPSMREHLDEGPLDWRLATRTIARAAQALHWMAERGHVHRRLRPEALRFRVEEDADDLQIGGWLQALLTHDETPLQTAEEGSYVGFASYLSPESIRDESTPDERSLVYSLGMLYYEMMLGKPPFASGSTEEILKQHLYEKPVKLSIAAEDRDLHPDLDDVLGMMWAKDADERFQTPKAAIAALSNLVGQKPHELAPSPSAADRPVFAPDTEGEDDGQGEPPGAELESSPEDEHETEAPARPVQDTEEMDEDPTTGAISGSVEVPSTDDGMTSGSSEVQSGEASIETESAPPEPETSSEHPSIIIEDPDLGSGEASGERTNDGVIRASADVESWTETFDASVRPPVDTPIVTGFDAQTEYAPESPARRSVTARNFAGARPVDVNAGSSAVEVEDGDLETDADGGGEPATELGVDIGEEIEESPSNSADEAPPTVPDDVSDPSPDASEASEDEPAIVLDETHEADLSPPTESPETSPDPGPATAHDEGTDTSSGGAEDANQEVFRAPDPHSGTATASAGELPGSSSDVGGEGRDADVSDEWFQVSDKEAWMAADVREERDRSEVLRQYVLYGVIFVVLAAALSLVVYSQTYEPADNQKNGTPAAGESSNSE